MNGPEALDSYQLLRGQGVGILTIECLSRQFSIRWDKKCGLIASVSEWRHGEDAENVLRKDLGLGYDVLILAGPRAEHVYLLRDESAQDDGCRSDDEEWDHEEEESAKTA